LYTAIFNHLDAVNYDYFFKRHDVSLFPA
jgi:hypothetical protein